MTRHSSPRDRTARLTSARARETLFTFVHASRVNRPRAMRDVRARDSARAAGRIRTDAMASVVLVLALAAPTRASDAGGPGHPPFAAAVFPSAVFAQREASVRVHGLNFLPGRDGTCADCNAGGATTTRCAFGGARDNGETSTFSNSDPSSYACAVNGVTGATGTKQMGFATGSWSANGGYDWAVFGGDRKQTEDGVVHFMKSPTVREVVASAGPMGIPTYAAGEDFARGTLGCYFESKSTAGTWVTRAVGTFAESAKHGGMFISSALYRCEPPTYDVTTPSKATLARFAVGVLGDDGSVLTNFISYKENYWLTPANASVSSGMYSTEGGEAISVVVSDSDGDLLDVGCLVGTTRVSARATTTTSVDCVAPAREAGSLASVPLKVGVRYAELAVSSIAQSTETTVYTGGTPLPSNPYELYDDELFYFGRGGQVMHLSSDEDFTCSLTTVIDAKTSVLKSTVANPSPFDSVINCLLPLNVEVGFVALGVTGGQYEGLVQVMFIDPPRATSASPRRSPSEGGGLAWVYGSNLDVGTKPYMSCVFTADESSSYVSKVGAGARVSSALIACELPPAKSVVIRNNQRTAAVAIVMRPASTANVNALDSGASIEYAVNVASASITPVRGSIDGGTPVHLDPSMSWVVSSGSTGTPDTDDFGTGGCRFSAVSVAARVADTGAIECVSPSLSRVPYMNVPVAIAVDWRTSSAPLVFFTSTNSFLNFSYVRF